MDCSFCVSATFSNCSQAPARKFDRRPIWKLSGINSPLMMEYPAHVRDMSSIGRSHSSACFFCNIAIIEIQFFLALCPSFPSSTSLCRFSSRSLVVVEFIVFPKIIWHILIGTWPSCTFHSWLCWFQRSWQQEAFYFSLFSNQLLWCSPPKLD